jgi:tetratricopeptide (TPR) repeat protein
MLMALTLWCCQVSSADRQRAYASGPEIEPAAGQVRRSPYDPSAAQRKVKFWEGRVAKQPDRFLDQRELAAAYLARQRETGDLQDAVLAEKAARRSLELQPNRNAGALNRLARSLLGQHRFPEALEIAKRAAVIDSNAVLLIADIEWELGNHDAARQAFASASVDPEELTALVMRARFAEAAGDRRRAIRLMRAAAEDADELADLPAESAAWYHAMLGHTLIDHGRLDEGVSECRTALAIFPRDYRALTGLAEAAAFRGEWDEVIPWCGKAIDVSAQNPEVFKLMADALAAKGDQTGFETQHQRFKQLAHSFPRIYDRHWALFCADNGLDLDEAYTLARKDLELRHDMGAYDTLAWVAFKKGLRSEAESAIREALERGLCDATVFVHAARIERAYGDSKRADELLARARTLNPYVARAATSTHIRDDSR